MTLITLNCVLLQKYYIIIIYRHIYLGMFLNLMGISLIVVSSYIRDSFPQPQDKISTHNYVYVMLAALFFYSIQKMLEEKLLKKNEISSRRFVGLQAVYSLIFIIFWQVLALILAKVLNNDSPVQQFAAKIHTPNTLMNIVFSCKHRFIFLNF